MYHHPDAAALQWARLLLMDPIGFLYLEAIVLKPTLPSRAALADDRNAIPPYHMRFKR